MSLWEVRRDGAVVSWGASAESFPNSKERKILRAHGHKIYVDGKPYKEG